MEAIVKGMNATSGAAFIFYFPDEIQKIFKTAIPFTKPHVIIPYNQDIDEEQQYNILNSSIL